MPHVACKECGTYAGRQVITMDSPIKSKKATDKKENNDKKTD